VRVFLQPFQKKTSPEQWLFYCSLEICLTEAIIFFTLGNNCSSSFRSLGKQLRYFSNKL
jgi:hypothetical protein